MPEQLTMFEYWEPSEDPRSKTPMEMVKEYQKTSGQKPDPYLYVSLIGEEYSEWYYADQDPEEELKELADIVYVIYGYANACGWDLDQALWRVHDNNMGRMYQPDGTIKRRADGKIVKNPNYPKVSLEDLV